MPKQNEQLAYLNLFLSILGMLIIFSGKVSFFTRTTPILIFPNRRCTIVICSLNKEDNPYYKGDAAFCMNEIGLFPQQYSYAVLLLCRSIFRNCQIFNELLLKIILLTRLHSECN